MFSPIKNISDADITANKNASGTSLNKNYYYYPASSAEEHNDLLT